MDKNNYYIIASSVATIMIAILALTYSPIPKIAGLPIVGLLAILCIILIIKGIRLKPEKQAEISKGLFVVDIVRYEFGNSAQKNYPQSQNRRILKLSVLFHIVPSRRVESFQLNFLHHLISTDWKSDIVGNNVLIEGGDLYFEIPDSIKQGKYTVKLIAYSIGEKFEFNPYEIEIPN